MTRSLLAILALLLLAVPSWGADPAKPAAMGEAYPVQAPAAGQTSPAADAGHAVAGVDRQAHQPWYTDLGSVAAVGIPVLLTFLSKMPLPPALAAALGPWGGLLSLLLGALKGLAQPYADKQKEKMRADHADALQELVRLTQLVSNFHTVAEWKAHLRESMSDKNQATIGALIASLEDQGIDHSVIDDLLRPDDAPQPLPAPASTGLVAAAK